MNSSATALRRTGKAKYVAMLVAKSQPANWQTSTLLLLFVERGGVATGFVVTSGAIVINVIPPQQYSTNFSTLSTLKLLFLVFIANSFDKSETETKK